MLPTHSTLGGKLCAVMSVLLVGPTGKLWTEIKIPDVYEVVNFALKRW